jgi:hypothetical protein
MDINVLAFLVPAGIIVSIHVLLEKWSLVSFLAWLINLSIDNTICSHASYLYPMQAHFWFCTW